MAITVLETGLQYTTIQQAIDAVASGAGLVGNRTIQIDGGVYFESPALTGTIHKTNGYTLYFTANGTVTLDGGGTANNNFYILNVSNIHLDGINMQNCSTSDTAGANFRVQGTTGVWGNCDNITLKNCSIRTGYAASRCTLYVRNVLIQNVTTSNCKFGTWRYGSATIDLENISFINCNCSTDGLQDPGANQFQLKGINGLNMTRCNFDGAEKIIVSAWFCDNVNIDGCIFTNSGILNATGRHLMLEDGCNNWVVQNCLFKKGPRQAPIYTSNGSNFTFKNNTFIDTTDAKTELVYHNIINGANYYNNIWEVVGGATVAVMRFINSPNCVIGNNMNSQSNLYHFKNGAQRNILNGTINSGALPSGGVTSAQGIGLEINSTQSLSTGNYVQFVDPVNDNYLLQDGSPAREVEYMTQLPVKDLRNYTRDTVASDIGCYDMDGIAPILPTSILNITVGGSPKTMPFGVLSNSNVTFINNSINAITTTVEIFNSFNTVIGSSNSFPYIFNFGVTGSYRIRMISTNNDGSDILDVPNGIIVDIAPTAIFAIPTPPYLINGVAATYSVNDSSTGGSTPQGGITAKFWELLNSANTVIKTSNSSPFVINGSDGPQGLYSVRLTVTNIVGQNTKLVTDGIRINLQPVLVNPVPLQVGTRLVPFSFIVPANTFSDTDSLSWTAPLLPTWATFTPSTRLIAGTPPTPGTNATTVRVTDPSGLFNESNFNINIGTGSPPSVANQPANKGVQVGAQFSYVVQNNIFYAPDPITLSIISKPNWMDYVNGVLVGEPAITDVGTSDIVIRADDTFTQADCTFTITVFDVGTVVDIANGETFGSVRGKLNKVIEFVNKLR